MRHRTAKVLLRFYLLTLTTMVAACGYQSHVIPDSAPVLDFSVQPTSIKQGQSIVATWFTTGATACNATGAWSGAEPTSDQAGVSVGPMMVAGTYTVGMMCTGNSRSTAVNRTVTVGAIPGPTIDFQIFPGSISPGNAATLSWSTSNATSCVGSGGTGSDGWSAVVPLDDITGESTGPIKTSGEDIYNLSCTGAGGTTEKSLILAVTAAAPPPVPTVTLTAQQTLVQTGQSAVFLWTSNNATACAANGGSGADDWSGSEPLSSTGAAVGPLLNPGTYSYTLSCTGPGGSADSSVSIAVAPSSQPPVPSISISIYPTQITAGSAAALNWTSSNVDSCTASGSWSGSKPTLGSNVSTGTLATAALYTYTLTCSGVGGSATGATVLTVNPPPASVLQFAAQPSTVSVGQTSLLSWSSSNATGCAASGGTSTDGWDGNAPLSSAGTTVGPFASSGAFTYTLVCTGPGGLGSPQSLTITVMSPVPLAASITSFSAAPTTVQLGQAAALNWTSNSASQCLASGGTGSDGWNGSVGTSGVGISTGPLANVGSITYTLVCAGPGGTSAASSVIVNVVSAPPAAATIIGFSASTNIVQVSQSTALEWSTTGATSCTASGGTGSDGWSGTIATASTGSPVGPFTVAGTITYTLTCSGPGGSSAPSSVIVNINNAPPSAAQVTSFAANPSTLQTGSSTSLSWSTSNATSCTASGGTGSDGWGGSVPVSSSGTTVGPFTAPGTVTYTVTCNGPGGNGGPNSTDVSVSAPPPGPATIASLTANPSTIQSGSASSLAWSSSGATACTASGGTGSDGWSGAQPASSSGFSTGIINNPGSYTYTLVCSGAGGASASSSAVLNVSAAPPPAASIASFYASPSTVQVGQSTSLTWSTVSATSCTASGGSSGDGWSGVIGTSSTGASIGPLNKVGSLVYTLTCSGPGGTSPSSSVTVNVVSGPAAPSIVSFSASSSAVEAGQSTSLSWSTLNASACAASGGTGSDGWSGALPAASSGTAVGPLTATGTDSFTLTCTGAGGTTNPASVNVIVSSAPPPATVTTFTALPSAIQTGQAAALSWSSSNATLCTAGGGTGSDGWGGTVGTANSGVSTGPITVAATYVYTLTCIGPGGTSAQSSATVVASVAPPQASITGFTATPANLLTGQSSQFAWSSANASSCSGSGGTGSDGWSSSLSTSSAGMTVGPFNAAGSFTYVLTCTGAGGPSAPDSIIVTVNNTPSAAAITSLSASPTSLQVGQSTTLSWSSSNATACTASGGTGSDGWSGVMGTASSGTSEGPFTAIGTITYSLVCSGPGGSSPQSSVSIGVTAATPVPPTVSLLIAGAASAQIQPGQSTTFSWTSSHATACTATGGTGSDGWPASRPATGSGVSIGPISVPGTYSYTLTCSGTGGTASSSVTLTVIATGAVDCGVGIPTTSLAGVGATATGFVNGGPYDLLCVLCSVSNPGNVIDSSATNFATMSLPAGVLGNTELLVGTPATFPAGRQVGFILVDGNTLLSLSLLGGVTIKTYAAGVEQEAASVGSLLSLSAVGAIAINSDAGFAGFTTTKPFDSVAIYVGSGISVLTSIDVYQACVSLQ